MDATLSFHRDAFIVKGNVQAQELWAVYSNWGPLLVSATALLSLPIFTRYPIDISSDGFEHISTLFTPEKDHESAPWFGNGILHGGPYCFLIIVAKIKQSCEILSVMNIDTVSRPISVNIPTIQWTDKNSTVKWNFSMTPGILKKDEMIQLEYGFIPAKANRIKKVTVSLIQTVNFNPDANLTSSFVAPLNSELQMTLFSIELVEKVTGEFWKQQSMDIPLIISSGVFPNIAFSTGTWGFRKTPDIKIRHCVQLTFEMEKSRTFSVQKPVIYVNYKVKEVIFNSSYDKGQMSVQDRIDSWRPCSFQLDQEHTPLFPFFLHEL